MEKSHALKILFLIFVPAFLFFVHLRGYIPYDEGWFIQGAYRMFQGQVPYRDFQFTYNPGGLYLNLLAFRLFGLSVLSSRLIALSLSLLTSWLLWCLGEKMKMNYWLRMLVILAFIFWGPGHINFVWPVMLCLPLGIGVCLSLISIDDKVHQKYFVFLAGVLSAGVFLAKQNFGLAIVISTVATFVLVKEFRQLKLFLAFIWGYFLIVSVQIAYLIKTNSLFSYLRDFYELTIVKIVKEGTLTSPYPWQYSSELIYKLTKTIIYLLPLLVAIVCFVFLWKKAKRLLVIPMVVASYYVFSIRPTTDYVHLTPLLAITAPLVYCFYKYSPLRITRSLIVLGLIIFIITGFYSSVYKRYYRWNTPLIGENVFISVPRVQILADESTNEIVTEINSYFLNKTNKHLFVYSFTPMFYFLLDKENPTPYDYLHPGFLTPAVDRDVASKLNKEKLPYLITDVNITNDISETARYIKENYQPDLIVGGFTIWKAI